MTTRNRLRRSRGSWSPSRALIAISARVPRETDFTSRLRSPAVSARIGVWLGAMFAVAFLTGLISHVAQSPSPWFPLPTRPSWGYRVTQGLHVATGTAAIPLLLVKLWTVFPKLFARIPKGTGPRLLVGAERLSVTVLVGAAIFQLASGLANSAQWYPWAFSFRATHLAMGWVAIGALIVHIAVKLPVIRQALAADLEDTSADPSTASPAGALSRRGLLRSTWVAAVAAVGLSVGSAVPLLRDVSLFGVRSGRGPAGIPINMSAAAAGVISTALSPAYRLLVICGNRKIELSRDELKSMPQTSAVLPIACVEGWSASGTWQGVRVRDLLTLVGAPTDRDIRVVSLQQEGAFRETTLPARFAGDSLTLLALSLNGEELAIDHGYPVRLIAPNRPGVLQTKWVQRLEVTS